MLKLLSIACICSLLAVSGFSQAPSIHLKPFKKKEFKMDYQSESWVLKDTTDKRIRQLRDNLAKSRLTEMQGRNSHTTSRGTVYILPTDNMPCLVPDPSLTVAMPNFYKHDSTNRQRMPNPGLRKKSW